MPTGNVRQRACTVLRVPAEILSTGDTDPAAARPAPVAADKWLTAVAAEAWVRDKATAVLDGNARAVAAGIRRRATTTGLTHDERKNADTCADYLTAKTPYLDYPTALHAGWPIATGVIEGACRHLVKDRMDLTGARWELAGAQAILKLRALHSNCDLDEYWQYHLTQERRRVHETRYLDGTIPRAA
jgi:hypothetical protein